MLGVTDPRLPSRSAQWGRPSASIYRTSTLVGAFGYLLVAIGVLGIAVATVILAFASAEVEHGPDVVLSQSPADFLILFGVPMAIVALGTGILRHYAGAFLGGLVLGGLLVAFGALGALGVITPTGFARWLLAPFGPAGPISLGVLVALVLLEGRRHFTRLG